MFYSLQLTSFGKKISTLRKQNKITQLTVSEQTGVNVDTIRRIEQGLVLPKLDTLLLLSSAYKVDLLQIFLEYCSDEPLKNIYNQLDPIMATMNTEEIIAFCDESIAFINMSADTSNLLLPIESDQLRYLLEGIKASTDSNQMDVSTDLLLKGLRCTQPEISFDKLSKLCFSEIELRLLYLIAANYLDLNKTDESIAILLHLLSMPDSTLSSKLRIKAHGLLSYNFFAIGDYKQSLHYADKGIELTRKAQTTYYAHTLLARKAVALLKLGQEGYEENMKLCIALLQFEGHTHLVEHYRQVSKERYHISI